MQHNSLIPFDFENQTIRAYSDEQEKSWFVGRDIALALGYSRPHEAIQEHCKLPKLLKSGDLPLLGIPPRGLLVIPESDVWRLILRSRLPKAQSVENWLMEEVLPTLRRTGAYTMPTATRPARRPKLFISLEDMPADIMRIRPAMRDRCMNYALQVARLTGCADMSTVREQFIEMCRTLYIGDTPLMFSGTAYTTVCAFVEKCLQEARGKNLRFTNIRKAYARWAERNGITDQPTDKTFAAVLRSHFEYYRSNGTIYTNIALTQEGLQ